MKETEVGPTRGNRAIERFFTNFSRSVESAGTVPPLESENTASDHRVAHMTVKMPRKESYEWITYTYRHFSEENQAGFVEWLVGQDWADVFLAVRADAKADAYQSLIDAAMDRFFPVRTVKRKSTDLPWINKAIRRKIRRRMAVYRLSLIHI